MPIITGLLLGLSTLLFIGPVFLYLLKSSIEGGFKAGFAVACGIILGDIICVYLALFGFAEYFESHISQLWLSILGGVILLFFGLKYLLAKDVSSEINEKFRSTSVLAYLLNGFLINFVNPFVFAVWFGFYTISYVKFQDFNSSVYILIVTLIVIFITDVLKVVFAQKIYHFIKPGNLSIVYKVFGFIMLIFSFRLFYSFIILLLY